VIILSAPKDAPLAHPKAPGFAGEKRRRKEEKGDDSTRRRPIKRSQLHGKRKTSRSWGRTGPALEKKKEKEKDRKAPSFHEAKGRILCLTKQGGLIEGVIAALLSLYQGRRKQGDRGKEKTSRRPVKKGEHLFKRPFRHRGEKGRKKINACCFDPQSRAPRGIWAS